MRRFAGGVAMAVLQVACTRAPSAAVTSSPPTLKDAFAGVFLIGTAVNSAQIDGRDTSGVALIARQFNAISPENVLKWESVEPRPGVFAFGPADRYVALGERHGMAVIGHTLVWHNQTPRWVFQDATGAPASRDTLIARMRSHIQAVVGRYKGRIRGWDAVNEALNEDGTLRQSPWLRIIGEDYIAMAFRFAHDADPAAELYYNDFSLEGTAKRAGAVRLVSSLRAQGVPITGVGMQEHQKLDWPTTAAIDSTIRALAATGVRLMVTELDVDPLPSNRGQRTEEIERRLQQAGAPDPYRAGLPDSVQQLLARRYREIFDVYLAHRDVIGRVTFWGVSDADSWLNNFPVRGRVNHPLLFDRARKPKPAYAAVLGAPRQTRSAAQVQRTPSLPFRDATLPIERRVADLLGRMTLEEKVAQMVCLWSGKKAITDAAGNFDPARAPRWFRAGIGRVERPQDGHDARGEAEFANAIQRWVRDSTRLGIPVLFNEEALHGLEAEGATSFPQAIALASTWNPELVQRVFAATAAEARARGVHQVLAPVVDIAREPRWGRFEETYGEDPFLVARMGVAAVRGLQGMQGSDSLIRAPHVLATLKHMTGHGQPESGTNVAPASIGERTLRDMFLYPFEVAIREAGAKSVMASYNEVDGVPSHVNRWMLHDVLRGEWGFDGTVVSDWFAIRQLVDRHHVAADSAEAARRALDATVDIELPDPDTYTTLVEQVRQKRVPIAQIDAAVRRLLRAKFMLGLFENPLVDADAADRISGAQSTRPLALEAARQAITLLKNDGNVLPLRAAATSRVAVIGPHAPEVLLGGYSGVPRHAVSILEGVRTRLGATGTVEYAEGVRITEDSAFTKEPQPHMGGARSKFRNGADRVVATDSASNARRIRDAVALARRSDVTILVLGDNEQTAREAYENNHLGDRASLGLPGEQEELALAVAATGRPVVLVLINGRPASIPKLVSKIPAILEGWYLGQETGDAVAEVLFGDVNPGGKLPVTVARDVGQLPVFYNYKPSARRGYVLDSIAPLFPFGFGLSYTTFSYGSLRVSPERIGPNGKAIVTVDVKNTGTRTGDEVVQLYVRDEVSQAARPVKELRGFQRVTIAPGATNTISFEIGPEHLSYHGLDMKRVVEPGRFQIMVGGSSADLRSVALTVNSQR